MTTIQWLCLVLYAFVVIGVLTQISLKGLAADKQQQHLVFGTAAVLFLFWVLRVGIHDGLDVHFLGLSVVTLLLGFRYSVIAGTLTLIGISFVGGTPLSEIAVQGVFSVLVPIGFTYLVYMLAFHKIPRHLFVYIFICAFFPGALTIALKTAFLGGYYWASDTYTWDVIRDSYIMLIPLLVFPEALLNGMAATLLVIYRPHWMYTFHDKFYLDGK